MPSTPGERLFAALGFAAVLVLVIVAFSSGGGDESNTVPEPPEPPPAQPAPRTNTEPPPPPTTTTTPRPARNAVLVVRATRGSSLVLIRADSESGDSMYEAVLDQGETIRFSAPRLWIRLGAAENIDLTLDGQPVERLPAGTIDLLATPGRVQAAG